MIKSNLTEQYQKTYLSYLTERYKQIWTFVSLRKKTFPVIPLDKLERVLGISLPKNEIANRRLTMDALSNQYNIANAVFNLEQLKVIAYKYKLSGRKSYVDLLVAHELLCYDNYMTDILVLLLEDMYNAVQIHKEFSEAVSTYCKASGFSSDDRISIDIEVDSSHGICYKGLMDYAHYGGIKPQIMFAVKNENSSRRCLIDIDDYEMEFNDISYNIVIRNIKFL